MKRTLRLQVALLAFLAAVAAGSVSRSGPEPARAQQPQGSGALASAAWQDFNKSMTLAPSDSSEGDHFGRSTALQGDAALIGASEAAYFFTRDGLGWIEQQKLVSSFAPEQESFGSSVALDGDTAVIGASSADVAGKEWQGAVYVFAKGGDGTWRELQKIVAADGQAQDHFGQTVALDGDTMAVGTRYGIGFGEVEPRSAVYLFTRSAGIWSEQQKLEADDGVLLGSDIALQGDSIIVGAANADVAGNEKQGAAYIFTRTVTGWVQQEKLVAGDGKPFDAFGRSVAIDRNAAIAGAPGEGEDGAAYFFMRKNATWFEQTKQTPDDWFGDIFVSFGVSVALDNDMAIVGGTGELDSRFYRGGRALIYKRSQGSWLWQQELLSYHRFFGLSVALDGGTALVATPSYAFTLSKGMVDVFEQRSTMFLPAVNGAG